MKRHTTIAILLGVSISWSASAADDFVGNAISNQPSKLTPIPRFDRLGQQLPSIVQRNRFNEFLAAAQVGAENQNYLAVKSVVDNVLDALSKRDIQRMSIYYSTDPQSSYFGPLLYDQTGRMVGAQTRSDYFQGLATSAAFFASVAIRRNDDEVFRIGDQFSLWTSTGYNFVVWKDGRQVTRPWRWTMLLEKTSDNKWMITHEHASFGDAIAVPNQ